MSGTVDPRLAAAGVKPKEAARMAAIGADAEFGNLLAFGKPTNAFWLSLIVVPVLTFIIAAFGLAGSLLQAHPRAPGDSTLFAVILGLSIGSGLAIWWLAHGRGAQLRFFERGVTRWRKRLGDVRRLSYLDVATMTYTVTRQNVKGVHVGSAGFVALEAERHSGNAKVKYHFKHREKAKGILRRRFEGTDPMDIVRDVVADAVAERLALEIAEKGEATWTGPTTFTKEGLRIKKLLGPPITMDYAKIDRLGFGDGTLVLFEEGKQKGFVSMAVNGKNFWPGFVLFQRLMTPRGGAEEIEGEEFEEEGD